MATMNPFDILGDDENEDPVQLAAAQLKKAAAVSAPKASSNAAAKKPAGSAAAAPQAIAKLPSKPLPPAEAVKEARNASESARGGMGRGGSGGGYARGRGPRGDFPPKRDFRADRPNGFAGESDGGNNGFGTGTGGAVVARGDESAQDTERGTRAPYRGGGVRRGGFGGDAGFDPDRPRVPRRTYERHSGTGRGHEFKREGAGRGNWGTFTDETPLTGENETIKAEEKVVGDELPSEQKDSLPAEEGKEGAVNETEEKEAEDKEMTLEEYEKIREEKRKALPALKAEERKVEVDKDLQSMLVLSNKKENDDIYLKLGAEKETQKKKESSDRAKKAVTVNELFKPAEGDRYYSSGGRGRGRGRGERGGFRGGYASGSSRFPLAAAVAPSIEDQNQFPTLGGK